MKFRICCQTVVFLSSVLLLTTSAKAAELIPFPPPPASIEKLPIPVQQFCQESYVGVSQMKLQAPCFFGALLFLSSDFTKAVAECKARLTSSSRPEMSCLIGAAIAREVSIQGSASTVTHHSLAEKMKSCRQHFPRYTELDNYMQQSCFFGVYLAHDSKGLPLAKPRFELCSRFTDEKSFVGPCATGLALASASVGASSKQGTLSATALNQLCTNRFDHGAFHLGYRACLNSQGLAVKNPIQNPRTLARECATVATTRHDESEQAACVIGSSLARALETKKDTLRSRHCAVSRPIRWSDRETLICMTAASLLDFGDPASARSACKEIFSGRRNSRRNTCFNEVSRIAAQPTLPPVQITPATSIAAQTTLTPESSLQYGSPNIRRAQIKSSSKTPAIGVAVGAPASSGSTSGKSPAAKEAASSDIVVGPDGLPSSPPTDDELWPEAPDAPIESLSASTANGATMPTEEIRTEGRVPTNSEDDAEEEDDAETEEAGSLLPKSHSP